VIVEDQLNTGFSYSHHQQKVSSGPTIHYNARVQRLH